MERSYGKISSSNLQEYETSSIARKAARRVSRSYSHSTVDELSGDEDVVVDAKMDEVPDRAEIHGGASGDVFEERKSPELVESAPGVVEIVENDSIGQQDASVRRILEIISDISVSFSSVL